MKPGYIIIICYTVSHAVETNHYVLFLFQERERDHFSQFITEGFTLYCKRKRRDKVFNIFLSNDSFPTLY
jgi:hypothetical protein